MQTIAHDKNFKEDLGSLSSATCFHISEFDRSNINVYIFVASKSEIGDT